MEIYVLKKSNDELKDFLNYELAPYPLIIFDEGRMRKGKNLYFFNKSNVDVNKFAYIIDGGMLLNKVKWQVQETLTSICIISNI